MKKIRPLMPVVWMLIGLVGLNAAASIDSLHPLHWIGLALNSIALGTLGGSWLFFAKKDR